MIQLHLNKDDYAYTLEQGFRPHMQVSDNSRIALSSTPWTWHARRQTIFNRDTWLFIEAESMFVVCFFDLSPRDIKQLDLTLWLRLISEYTFMSQKRHLGKPLPLCDDFLSITRSWMAPMELKESQAEAIDEYANSIFDQLQKFMQRPLPFPIPLRFEMEFCWDVNTGSYPSSFKKPVELQQRIQTQKSIFYGTSLDSMNLPVEELDFDLMNLDDIEIMDLIHKHVKSNNTKVTPLCLFTGRMALMVDDQAPSDNVIEFQPRC